MGTLFRIENIVRESGNARTDVISILKGNLHGVDVRCRLQLLDVKNVFMAEKGRQQIAGIKSRASAVGRNIRGAFRSGIKNIVSSFSGISGVYTGHVLGLPGRGMAAANHKLSDGLGAVRGKLGDAYQAARNNVMTKKKH